MIQQTTTAPQPFAVTAYPVLYRSYLRMIDGKRETFEEMSKRVLNGLVELGNLTDTQADLITESMHSLHSLPSGRWLWVGGTEHLRDPENVYSAYNCSSCEVDDLSVFPLLMNIAMQGCGTGGVLEDKNLSKLPSIKSSHLISVVGDFKSCSGNPKTKVYPSSRGQLYIKVGDSREGWVTAYHALISLYTEETSIYEVFIDLSEVRDVGVPLKGFGGTANPIELPRMFTRIGEILNDVASRENPQLTAEDCCLLADEPGLAIVAGNIRRKAGIFQFSSNQPLLKTNLWQPDENGNWFIDPKRHALRMSNHTVVYHYKPSFQECLDSVASQYASGEGAIQYAPEAIARANADLLNSEKKKQAFLDAYNGNYPEITGRDYLEALLARTPKYSCLPESEQVSEQVQKEFGEEITHRLNRYGQNACVTGDAWVLTSEGRKQVKELVNVDFEVVLCNPQVAKGSYQSKGFWSNGVKTVYELTLEETEITLKVTPDHLILRKNGRTQDWEWIELKDLRVGDKLALSMPDVSIEYRSDIDWIKAIHFVGEEEVFDCSVEEVHCFSANGIIVHNCGEIVGSNFFCNLSEAFLNTINPFDLDAQRKALQATGLSVASLLNHEFPHKRMQRSRELDPIVAACISGVFDFFVHAFGVDWLQWWSEGRPNNWNTGNWRTRSVNKVLEFITEQGFLIPHEYQYQDVTNLSQSAVFRLIEATYLNWWKTIARDTIYTYCDQHGLKKPNRYTAVQPSGTKSLITGASCGWHPPKAIRCIRRMEFEVDSPIALALKDYGYRIIPNQASTNENGQLLGEEEIYNPYCKGWLIEIPIKVSWADLEGVENYPPDNYPAVAQFDFMMQVQRYYTTHNTSATIEVRQSELAELASLLHQTIQRDRGYISSPILARFDDYQTFPRLPFEPISEDTYQQRIQEVIDNRVSDNFHELLVKYDKGEEESPNACDGKSCMGY